MKSGFYQRYSSRGPPSDRVNHRRLGLAGGRKKKSQTKDVTETRSKNTYDASSTNSLRPFDIFTLRNQFQTSDTLLNSSLVHFATFLSEFSRKHGVMKELCNGCSF